MAEQYLPKDRALHENFLKANAEQQRDYALNELMQIVKARASDAWSKDKKQVITLSEMAKKITQSIRSDYQQQIEFCFPDPDPFRLKTRQVKEWISGLAPEYAKRNDKEGYVIDYEYSELGDNVHIGYPAPARMCKLFNWVAALDAWDYCDPEPLSKMIEFHSIPPEFMKIVADIISGKRKQNKRGAAKLKSVPPDQRMLVAVAILSYRQFPEAVLSSANADRRAEIAADRGVDPIVIRRELEASQKKWDQAFADLCGLSVEGVKDLTDALKRKCKTFPNL